MKKYNNQTLEFELYNSLTPNSQNPYKTQDVAQFHLKLNHFNHKRLTPRIPPINWENEIRETSEILIAEGNYLENERNKIKSLAAEAPTDVQGFIEWFEAQKYNGPGQFDPLFDWLATTANYDQMRWFISQELAGEAGFDDLVALTQLKLPLQAKLELARNFWDEMGQGNIKKMHGVLLHNVAEEMNLVDQSEFEILWETLALSNLLVGLASNRSYAFHALGALGAIELTAPTRVSKVAAGLKRLGLSNRAIQYFRLHSTVDIKHAEDWQREVFESMIKENPDIAVYIAEGVLMRLNAGARCFDRYRSQFGLEDLKAHIE